MRNRRLFVPRKLQVFLLATAVTTILPTQTNAAIDETKPSSISAEIVADWKDQGGTAEQIKASLPAEYQAKCDGSLESACHWRRVARLSPFADIIEKVIFCEHHDFGGIVVGYHDNVDAANSDSKWSGSSKLCVMNFKTYYPEIETIFSENRVIRDPCISFDGKKCLIAISGSGSKGSGYNIYEFSIDDPKNSLKQLTKQMSGATIADFEPCYLPNGEIAFSSTRNFGLTDCAFHTTVNMFMMSGDGSHMRQIGFDQVHTFYPQMQADGTVLYTRWEYNDRDITNTMGLFTMYPDGSRQIEFFGNQTSWPFTMQHARPIPMSTKVIAVAGGHHGPYSGELMLIDNQKGYNGTQSIEMIAPRRETKPAVKKSDLAMGHVQFLFEYPYPLDEENFIVAWRKSESGSYRLYWMDPDGNRELLAWSSKSVCQAVPITTWKNIWGGDAIPPMPKVQADYSKTEGTFTMENVYIDPYCGPKKMDPIPAGKAKTLRVIELGYRAQGAGNFGSVMGSAPAGLFGPAIFCPISTFGCSWEAKKVLGEATIQEDGSANFKVPARVPVYFQVIDEKGYCLATMRSWSTLMPGETFQCVGCHESKTSAPPITGITEAMKNPSETLKKPLGIEDKWFDFKKMVAPILDKKCASCHKSGHSSGFDMRNTDASGPSRTWTTSYNSLTKGLNNKSSNNAINICYIFQQSEPLPYGSFGAIKSGMMKNIEEGHHDVSLTDNEKKIIACWIDLAAPHGGFYDDYLTKSGYDKLQAKRDAWVQIEKENLKDYVVAVRQERAKAAGAFVENISIGYLPKMRALVLTNVVKGNLILVDLIGREVARMKVSDLQKSARIQISLPASLGTGLYLAKFEGADGKMQKGKITVTE